MEATDGPRPATWFDALCCRNGGPGHPCPGVWRLRARVAAGRGLGAGSNRARLCFGSADAAMRRRLALQRNRELSVRILFPYLIVWTSRKVPALVVAPQIEGARMGLGQVCACRWLGGLDLVPAVFGGTGQEGSILEIRKGRKGDSDSRDILFAHPWVTGLSDRMVSHVEATALISIRARIPFNNFLRLPDGIGHMALGLGVLFGRLPRVAAWAEDGNVERDHASGLGRLSDLRPHRRRDALDGIL